MTDDLAISAQLLPGVRFNFHQKIDLMDETLREGAERATVPPDFDAKRRLAGAIAGCGVKTLVVGMFPDVPHNEELLTRLLEMQAAGDIPADVRFMVISHVGVTMEETFRALERVPYSKSTVWIVAIHAVSDQQIQHLFPTILRKDPAAARSYDDWESLPVAERRARNLDWFDRYLPRLRAYQGGGVMIGLIDAFRADASHLREVVDTVARHSPRQIRLLDSAGSCLPQQVPAMVGELIARHPGIDFYGHFHDDFGMATANGLVGLSLGMRGVDVSVGGFANRAGHAPLAEVAMALRLLYGIELPGFRYERLFDLSRQLERTYGLMESPTQAITGVITHAVQSGIRTELLRKAPRIFDVLDPVLVGANLAKTFGVRSGRDGLMRFLQENVQSLRPLGLEPSQRLADELYQGLEAEWRRRSATSLGRLQELLGAYQRTLTESFFSEGEILNWIKAQRPSEVMS